ncbi:hypothetical protein Barb7_00648 [Bacteroidales bacterium Barb7]|nr:hypothetical protein Barb7_00648 [Bacteroidales bacterium Barb7]
MKMNAPNERRKYNSNPIPLPNPTLKSGHRFSWPFPVKRPNAINNVMKLTCKGKTELFSRIIPDSCLSSSVLHTGRRGNRWLVLWRMTIQCPVALFLRDKHQQ